MAQKFNVTYKVEGGVIPQTRVLRLPGDNPEAEAKAWLDAVSDNIVLLSVSAAETPQA